MSLYNLGELVELRTVVHLAGLDLRSGIIHTHLVGTLWNHVDRFSRVFGMFVPFNPVVTLEFLDTIEHLLFAHIAK